MDPRQMSMMMKKFGIDVRDIEGVQRVVIQTATKDYVFDRASVSVMKAQGVETWQLSGKPRIVEHGAAPVSPTPPAGPGTLAPAPAASTPAASTASSAALVIPDDDVALVARETGRPPAEARAALQATNGDLAEAIVRLQG